MITFLSITGLFKTLLIILGAFVLLKFLGQLMNAKNNMAAENELKAQNKQFEQEKNAKMKNLGKTQILKEKPAPNAVQDVDFEEVKD